MANDRRKSGAAELLGDWRAAERDTIAAKAAKSIAEQALAAAHAAQEAATESEAAAQAALKAAQRAQAAADAAKSIAHNLAGAMDIDEGEARKAKDDANHVLADAEGAETHARDRFHEAEAKGFPKDPA